MKHGISARIGRLGRHGIRLRRVRPGTMAGSLDAPSAGEAADRGPARVTLMRYDTQHTLEEFHDVSLEDLDAPAPDAAGVTWLHLQGQPDAAQVQALGRLFGLHALALEDVLHQEARAKVEAFSSHYFVVLHHIHSASNGEYTVDQLSFFLGANYVVSVDQGSEDLFESVRGRIRHAGKIRGQGADFLLYALLDLIVDGGFALLEALGDRLELLEDEILEDPSREARDRIHYIKRELVLMRRIYWPQREVITALMRDDEHMLSDTTRLYLRDCYDHCVIVIDFVETYREMAFSLLDIYLSAISQRMNDIMKGLTIIATIFLPLTFLTGIYGMNFDTSSPWNMPELSWRYGYAYVLGVMAVIVVAMLLFFHRKRWL